MSRFEKNLTTGETAELPDAEPSYTPPTIEQLRAAMILTPTQARFKLAGLGLLAQVNSAINQLPETDAMRIKWEYATQIERLDPDLTGFCKNTLGMSDEQIDGLFL